MAAILLAVLILFVALLLRPGPPAGPAPVTVSGPGGSVTVTPPTVTTQANPAPAPNVAPVSLELTPGLGETYALAAPDTVWPGAPAGWQPPPVPAWLHQYGVRGYLALGAVSPGGTTDADSRPLFPEFAQPKDRTWVFNHLDKLNANRGGQPYAYVSGTTPMLAWYERKDKTGGGGLKKLFGGSSPLSGLLGTLNAFNPLSSLTPRIAVAAPIRS